MNRKGFTLVELMVVLAILGLLAGVGVPRYMETLNRARTNADLASIATVQSAVNAFMAETGALPSELDSATAGSLIAATSPAKKSLIDNTTDLTLANFLPGGVLPTLKTYPSAVWRINNVGVVFVAAAADSAAALLPVGTTVTAP